jgi:signal transduction histidine kinase
VITGNLAANQLMGTSPETNISQTAVATGEAPHIRVLKEDGTEYEPHELPMQRAVATRQPVYDAVLDFRFSDGRMVQAFGNAVPLLDENGRARGCLGAFHDITELKRAQAALVEARQEAEKANQTKDHFIAVLSHELRTPLTPVMLVLSLWQQTSDLPEFIREDLEMMTRNIQLEIRLINDLLDLNRISSNKIQLSRELVDLNRILHHTCGICEPLVNEKNILVTTAFGPGLEHVTADPVRLQQIFWNLLSNAVKFTPEGGSIGIISRRIDPDRCEVRFRDTGMGVSPQTMPHIFDAFDQGSDYITRQFGGLGLGLAICRALVELHGGTIWAESGGEGHGSTFIVVLPLDGRGPLSLT